MPRLLLLRHAKAESIERGAVDFDRQLTPRGKAAATLIGRYMALNRIAPDRVLCSPSERARQTIKLVQEELGASPETVLTSALYNATIEVLVDQIREHGGEAGTLLVVGHNPAVEEALAFLVKPSADSQKLPPSYPSAALAIVAVQDDDWHGLQEHSGRLQAFIRPRDLEGRQPGKE